MEIKKNLGKRALSSVLTLLMVLSLAPLSTFSASAADQAELPVSTDAGLKALSLKSVTAEKWIDRLDLSGEAQVFQGFYDTLVEASDNDGVDDFLIEDQYFDGDNSIEVVAVDGLLTGPYSSNDELRAALREVATKLNSVYSPYINAVGGAFKRDNPEVFWLDKQTKTVCSYGASGNSQTGYNYTVTFTYVLQDQSSSFDIREAKYNSETAIKSAINTVNSKVDSIVNAVSNKPIHDQVKYFNHILTTTNEYNTSSDLNNIDRSCRECTSALMGSVGTEGPVCEAYAKAFKVLCDKAGIPCILADGTAGEGHMWNYTQVDGSWYAVDVTWNDPVVNGISGAVSGYEGEEYLLVGSKTLIDGVAFDSSHTLENRVTTSGIKFINQPVSSNTAFQCQHKNGFGVNGFCASCGEVEPANYNVATGVYEISKAGQLYWYAQQLNENNAEIYVELTSDIIIPENAPNWVPINSSTVHFNGNFKTISGLKCIGGEGDAYVGLFGNNGRLYEISNLHITNSYFEGKSYVGAVVASMNNSGNVTNCYVTNTTVKGNSNTVGAVVGYLNTGSVVNCYADTNTLVGQNNNGNIQNSYYLSNTDDGMGGKTAEQFATGEVAYLLGEAYGQIIGKDNFPVFGGEKVYCVTNCKNEYIFSNTNANIGHNMTNGVCTICGTPCSHNENIKYTINNDGTHSLICYVCGTTITKAHTIDEAGKCECGMKAVVSTTIGDTTIYHPVFSDAIKAVENCNADNNAVVKLMDTIDLGDSYQSVNSGVFTIDLNGQTLSGSSDSGLLLILGGNVTITDSGEEGTIYSENVSLYAGANSSVLITDGIFKSNNATAVFNDGGNVTVIGGTIIGFTADVSENVKLDVNSSGVGAYFPDGLESLGYLVSEKNYTLQNLADGVSPWAVVDGKDIMIVLTDETQKISDMGDITIRKTCDHANGIKQNYINNGDNHSFTYSCCGVVNSEEHTFVNCKCICNAMEPVDKLTGYTVSLGGKTAVNYYMHLTEQTLNDTNAKMIFTVPDTGSTYTVEIPVSEAVKSGDYYVFTCDVAAKEMTSVIKAQLVTSNGESEVFEYTVQQYCQYIIENPDKYSESDVEIVKSMLNYGASAQIYFNYNIDNLANSVLNDDDKAIIEDPDLSAYASSVSGEEAGVSFYGGALSLESETAIKLYFEIDENIDINTLPITVEGTAVTVTKNGKYYQLVISNIPVHKLDNMYEVKIGDLTVNYGAFSYGYTALKTDKDSLKNVVKTLYTYASSVK